MNLSDITDSNLLGALSKVNDPEEMLKLLIEILDSPMAPIGILLDM